MGSGELKYERQHEWVRVEGDIVTIGISDYAQSQLGDVVFVDLPSAGDTITMGETFGEIESVKSVSELYAPVSGEVVKVNDELDATPETVNSDPLGAGWMIQVRIDDPSQLDGLMTAEEYEAFINEGA